MGTPISPRLVRTVTAAVLMACGGEGLTLPGDGAPAAPVDGAPAALTAHAGDGQEGTAGSRLAAPLVVRVTDSGSRPLAGVAIVFRFQSDAPGGEVNPTQAATNVQGLAEAKVRLGENTGSQTIEAQVAASTLRATFDLTALEHEEDGRGGGGDGHGDDGDDD